MREIRKRIKIIDEDGFTGGTEWQNYWHFYMMFAGWLAMVIFFAWMVL